MDKPVVIIHFQPLELYPPVMNLLKFLSTVNQGRIIVFTTSTQQPQALFQVNDSRISIRRIGFSGKGLSSLKRYLYYLQFYTLCCIQLMVLKPLKILYFETLSSFPAYLYRRYISKKASILAHYHEYTSPEEYAGGMKLARYFHKKEQWLYPHMKWISHTNKERLQRFQSDEKLADGSTGHIMPNYPGKAWLQKKAGNTGYARIVYVGAVSRETMYFENFINWVLQQHGRFTFDIFSSHISEEDKRWIMQCDEKCIRLHAAVDYYSLPAILAQYDTGVILYKGHIPNYVINAPNKLFEYLACGLDVWVAREITGCSSYYTHNTWPRVLPVDFQRMEHFDWQAAVEKAGLHYLPPSWYYEEVYPAIAGALFSRP